MNSSQNLKQRKNRSKLDRVKHSLPANLKAFNSPGKEKHLKNESLDIRSVNKWNTTSIRSPRNNIRNSQVSIRNLKTPTKGLKTSSVFKKNKFKHVKKQSYIGSATKNYDSMKNVITKKNSERMLPNKNTNTNTSRSII